MRFSHWTMRPSRPPPRSSRCKTIAVTMPDALFDRINSGICPATTSRPYMTQDCYLSALFFSTCWLQFIFISHAVTIFNRRSLRNNPLTYQPPLLLRGLNSLQLMFLIPSLHGPYLIHIVDIWRMYLFPAIRRCSSPMLRCCRSSSSMDQRCRIFRSLQISATLYTCAYFYSACSSIDDVSAATSGSIK